MADRNSLTAARLREVLHYDPDTGVFTWVKPTNRRIRVGAVAGCIDGKHGHRIIIGIDGDLHLAHRLAWLYMTGEWPEHEIDHKNGDRMENPFDNLRDATRKLNQQNQRRARCDSKSGIQGVRAVGENFRASIRVDGSPVSLGTHPTSDQASAAFVEAKRLYHPGNTL